MNKDKDMVVNDFTDYVIKPTSITIYNKDTIDYKGKFIARLFKIEPGRVIPTNIINISDNLETIRSSIPKHMHCFQACEIDDKNIIETWI